ncbi:MAG: GH116 family glycosyl hydrolase, partial [bacterium]|nr:GH116 family glycosyl hydrolase [bacterium]
SSNCCSESEPPLWKPFYVSQWKNARDVDTFVRKHYDTLRNRTRAFHQALFASTLPGYALDAISANLAILKSPTVLRQENGNVWAWEGCFVDHGCCSGSCTHVWNYAQALPHLFPQLERTLREQELERSMNEQGHVNFRSALPDGPTAHTFRAACDGQLGGIMKLYREWQISGDQNWLQNMYPLARNSMVYCIEAWDPRHRGILEEPHHNTYDIEFWGPDGMCTSIYLGALAAMAELASDSGHPEEADFYQNLAKSGAKYLDKHLFNGEYYEQKVTYKGLRDTSFSDLIKKVTRKSGEVEQLLKKEGPKYQYGTGCISDGVIGAWMARIYGINSPQTRTKIRRNLKAIFQYNFKPDLADHACTQRPGYALGHEPGLLLCSWPRGGKPTLPFVYSDEVWTGIEYQVASHLIEEGLVAEGLTIVKAARDRYNGRVRNPWNEYECGNYYARAMASYALLGSLSGFRYSRAKKTLWLAPKLSLNRFKTFFCTATGFGTLTCTDKSITIDMVEGEVEVDALYLNGKQVHLKQPLAVHSGKKTTVRL